MNPETIDAMLAAGVTAEVLAAAWKADISARAKSTEERREKDRDRQRRHRESRGVTVTNAQNRDPAPNERDNLTPTHEKKTEAKASSKNGGRNGTRLPDCWEPKPLIGKTAEMVAAWPAGMIERELAKFKDHWLKTPGARGRSLDWDASYRNWLRTADERKPNYGQPASTNGLRGSRPNLTQLLRASSSDPEGGFGARAALPASGNG